MQPSASASQLTKLNYSWIYQPVSCNILVESVQQLLCDPITYRQTPSCFIVLEKIYTLYVKGRQFSTRIQAEKQHRTKPLFFQKYEEKVDIDKRRRQAEIENYLSLTFGWQALTGTRWVLPTAPNKIHHNNYLSSLTDGAASREKLVHVQHTDVGTSLLPTAQHNNYLTNTRLD